LTVCVVTPENH